MKKLKMSENQVSSLIIGLLIFWLEHQLSLLQATVWVY